VAAAAAAAAGWSSTTAPGWSNKQLPPVVKIDNASDAFATVVSVELGDEGTLEMLGMISALKKLGLNIRRATVKAVSDTAHKNKFYLTEQDTSEKIVKSSRLEEIRLTIIDAIVSEFPGVADTAFAAARGASLGKHLVKANIEIEEAPNGTCSVLRIDTADRPGLLVDMVRVLKDVNMNVVSAEVNTIGRHAHDEFFVTYKGESLSSPMVALVTNALQYYLSMHEVTNEQSC